MRMRDSRGGGGDVSKMSTLDFLVTKMRKHVRSSSADSSPARHVIVEDEVEMRVSEDEGQVDPEDANMPNPHHRPPIYNPEDYAHALAKYARMPNLYTPDIIPKEKKSRGRDKEKSVSRGDVPQEMSLKQFGSLAELLRKLREDLKISYLSFVKEYVRDPNDGVTLLLDVLKMIQLSQTDLNGSANTREQQIALRRALIDEHESLSCLRYCLRSTDSALKLAHYHHGLYTLAVATMSNLARSRTLSLQLLTRACLASAGGHRQVMEALATLRLRFAEPVKCKFLVAMMLSHPHPSFQVWSMRFINALMSSTTSLREKIYLQEEMAEAGFDAQALRKVIERSGSDHLQQQAVAEIDRWMSMYIDVANFENEMDGLRSSNTNLQEELKKLREANMKLLEENVLLKTVGSEVEERYAALQRRLEQNGIPTAPSPAPSVSDSDLSSINTFRNATMHRNSASPTRNGGVKTDIMETDSVIFSQGGERSLTPLWNQSPKSSASHSGISSKLSTASDETAISSRPVSASSSSDLTPINRSRNQSCSSTPEPRMTSPLRSLTTSPNRNGDGKECRERDSSSSNRTSPLHEMDRKKSPVERYNEHMPLNIIDMTFRTEKTPSQEEPNMTDRSRSPPDGMVSPQEPIRSSRPNSQHHQQKNEDSMLIQVHEAEARKSTSPTVKDNKGSGKTSSVVSHTPSPRTKSPSNTKRRAPKPPPCGSSSPFSSSTSSLSSSSSNSGGERKDPEYMNVPFHESSRGKGRSRSPSDKPRCGSDEGDLDYERDVVVYEAITVANDRIFIDKNNTQGSHGSSKSQSSVETRGSLESREGEDSSADGPNVRESVRHYENLVMMTDVPDSKVEVKMDGERNEVQKREEKLDKKEKRGDQKDKDGNKQGKRDVSDREVEDVMTGFENVLRSAESSLSLASQETVKENPLLKEPFEDRASPENTLTEELEIVPTRVPHLPSRARSRNSQGGSGSQLDPVLYLEFESPAETSDTETLLRNNQPLPSPRTIETESTTSFGYVRPEKSLRRHETFIDRSSSERESKDEHRRGIRRSESFQMSNKSDYNSHRSYSPRRRGSMDLLVPLEEKEIHISGRTFTKYTPHEVERRNRVNELITAEMNRRKNRSMEDRLDQWFENQGDENDWTLKWKYPDISREREEKQNGQKSSRRQESRSPTRADNNKKSSKSKNTENPSPSKHEKAAEPPTPVAKASRSGKQKFSTSEIIAFNGFKNPSGFRESDYGPNFMLNKPSSRLPDFSDYGGRDYPPPPSRGRSSRDNWGANGRDKRRKSDIGPDIPTPDYSATPAGTMSNGIKSSPSKHILDMPSGLY